MQTTESEPSSSIELGVAPLRIEDIVALATGRAQARLCRAPAYREQLARSLALLEQALAQGQPIYGVTTGFGDSCEVAVPEDEVARPAW